MYILRIVYYELKIFIVNNNIEYGVKIIRVFGIKESIIFLFIYEVIMWNLDGDFLLYFFLYLE